MFRVYLHLPKLFFFVILGMINGGTAECCDSKDCVPISSCQTLNYNYNNVSEEDLGLYLATSKCQCPENVTHPMMCCESDHATILPDGNNCGTSVPRPTVAGGSAAGIYDYPWMAVLEFRDPPSTRPYKDCAGSLINHRYVLTAAHCFNTRRKLFQVHLGVYHLDNRTSCVLGECTHPVLTVGVEGDPIIHDDYPNSNDIALIRLSKTVYYTAFIRPICLPSTAGLRPVTQSTHHFIAGWGSDGIHSRTEIKQELAVQIYDLTKCRERYAELFYSVSQSQLCAGGESGKGACAGDSGSPLMSVVGLQANLLKKRYVVVGVTAYGLSNNYCAEYPGVYTSVFKFEDWIRGKIRP